MIHPALEPYVAEARAHPRPDPSTVDAAERRAQYNARAAALRGTPETSIEVMAEIRALPLSLPGRTLHARLYVPVGDESRALVLFFHGGSYVEGDLNSHDGLCRRMANATKMRVLALDYRLAPEHTFQSAVDDAIDAVRAVAARTDLAAPGARVVVMGDSAGAALATVAATATRGESPGVVAQVLIYPALGPGVLTDSGHEYARGYFLDVDHLRYDYEQYLAGADATDPRVSPLMSEDLAGSPPAVVVVAECDPLRDEGVAYAGLLEHFGVAVELLEAKGMPHGFLRMGGVVPEALEIVDDLAEHLHRLVGAA
ncbi:MAG: alpha/beta hydrolase [Acidimicrobiales bacterium]